MFTLCFFFNDTATTEIYTLSLHDALPIFEQYEDIYFSPSIDIKHENIETESTASDSIKKMDGDYFTSNFQYGITLDKRNQSWQPTEGYATSFYQKLPLILDSSSISNNFNASLYNEFSEDVIGSLKFQLDRKSVV